MSATRIVGLWAVAGSLAALAAALAMQYLGGLAPCPLCLWQRYAYGGVIAFGLLAWVLPTRATALAAALAPFGVAGLALFHVGVEQKWWKGLSGCSSPALEAGMSLEDFTAAILDGATTPCDQVPWSLFGISIAGYNGLYALALGMTCLWLHAKSR